jgi:hypothetical protein
MKPYLFLFSCILAMLMAACTDTGKPGAATPKTDPDSGAKQTDNRPVVRLHGAYATSNAGSNYRLQNLFDADSTTGWRTRNGAGPDEGVMLYFAEPSTIQFIQLRPLAGSADVPVTVYENGKSGPKGNLGQKITLSGQPLRSLYLRFGSPQSANTTKRTEADMKLAVETFPENGFVGLQHLQLFDAQGAELRIVAPLRIEGDARATSTLSPQSAYGVKNLFDARKEFVWVEGNAANDGKGESIQFNFREKVTITALQIRNGYQRSDEHFQANARLKAFSFGAAGATASTYALQDQQDPQMIGLQTPLEGQSFQLTIESAFPGKKYKDLALSDLVFFNGQDAFVVESGATENTSVAKLGDSPLNALLDRRIANQVSLPDLNIDQSFILRSDGTFVFYRNEKWIDGVDSEQLADGNWEILSADANKAQVKIFGKMTDLSRYEEYYKGTVNNQFTRIFKDVLTIDGKMIKGKDFMQPVYIH